MYFEIFVVDITRLIIIIIRLVDGLMSNVSKESAASVFRVEG
jgi:hypothetical protein